MTAQFIVNTYPQNDSPIHRKHLPLKRLPGSSWTPITKGQFSLLRTPVSKSNRHHVKLNELIEKMKKFERRRRRRRWRFDCGILDQSRSDTLANQILLILFDSGIWDWNEPLVQNSSCDSVVIIRTHQHLHAGCWRIDVPPDLVMLRYDPISPRLAEQDPPDAERRVLETHGVVPVQLKVPAVALPWQKVEDSVKGRTGITPNFN